MEAYAPLQPPKVGDGDLQMLLQLPQMGAGNSQMSLEPPHVGAVDSHSPLQSPHMGAQMQLEICRFLPSFPKWGLDNGKVVLAIVMSSNSLFKLRIQPIIWLLWVPLI